MWILASKYLRMSESAILTGSVSVLSLSRENETFAASTDNSRTHKKQRIRDFLLQTLFTFREMGKRDSSDL
jgi:hypothetical protein